MHNTAKSVAANFHLMRHHSADFWRGCAILPGDRMDRENNMAPERTACYSRLMFYALKEPRRGRRLLQRTGLHWTTRKEPEKLYDYLLRRWEREGGRR